MQGCTTHEPRQRSSRNQPQRSCRAHLARLDGRIEQLSSDERTMVLVLPLYGAVTSQVEFLFMKRETSLDAGPNHWLARLPGRIDDQ